MERFEILIEHRQELLKMRADGCRTIEDALLSVNRNIAEEITTYICCRDGEAKSVGAVHKIKEVNAVIQQIFGGGYMDLFQYKHGFSKDMLIEFFKTFYAQKSAVYKKNGMPCLFDIANNFIHWVPLHLKKMSDQFKGNGTKETPS